MAMHHCSIHSRATTSSLTRIYMCQPSENQNNRIQEVTITRQFEPLESVFRRRLLTGIGTASLVALGADFAGITSSLLGLSPDTARKLRFDIIYPIGGYFRCLEENVGFEFIYPTTWVGDQTVLSRAAGKLERSLDPLPGDRGRKYANEPVVAFGPPGSNGELNVSVIVSPVPIDFSIEAFGGPNEVGETIVKIITGRRPDVKGKLIQTNLREDSRLSNLKYYTLEFQVESPAFRRHNVAVCCAREGKLFTLNSQAPESLWPKVKKDFYTIADSFSLTS